MNTQTVQIINSSPNTLIYVVLKPPEDANIPSSQSKTTLIHPDSATKIAVRDGTMNLFVWTDPTDRPVWTGIIPTKIRKPISIFPETKDVHYNGISLPSGFLPVTDPSGPGFEHQIKNSKSTRWILLAIIIVLLGVWYWRK